MLAADPGGGGAFLQFLPFILIFGIFYFLVILPQQRQRRKTQDMLANLKTGDRVITSGGIYGLITNIDESTATLEIAEKVRIKVTRGSIAGLSVEAPAQASKKE